MSESCPQCKSEKTEYRGLFEGREYEWCDNEWVDLSAEEIEETVSEDDEFDVATYTNVLTVSRVDGWEIYLDGQQSGEYRLAVHSDGSATFYRKKSGNERNEFGKKWKREEQDVGFEYLDGE